jgi:hypothetical protein
MLTPTGHFDQRIFERDISADEIAAALAGRLYRFPDGTTLYYDRKSRVGLVVRDGHVVTAYRLRRNEVKRRFCNAVLLHGGNG